MLLLGFAIPKWLVSLGTIALANGLVSLGILIMMRSGVVPFGQGLVFAAGGYAAALAFNKMGISDILALCALGGVSALVVAAPFAPLLARYRGIYLLVANLYNNAPNDGTVNHLHHLNFSVHCFYQFHH